MNARPWQLEPQRHEAYNGERWRWKMNKRSLADLSFCGCMKRPVTNVFSARVHSGVPSSPHSRTSLNLENKHKLIIQWFPLIRSTWRDKSGQEEPEWHFCSENSENSDVGCGERGRTFSSGVEGFVYRQAVYMTETCLIATKWNLHRH